MSDPWEARYELARQLAVEAGQLTLRYYRASFDVERKADGSPVTAADRGAEQLIRDRLAERFPNDGILGEEFGAASGTSGYRWILDPIDGTKSFISGVPLYGTMVAVERDGVCELGAIYFPPLGELIHARLGHGAWHGPPNEAAAAALVDNSVRLADGLFVTSEVSNFRHRQAIGAYEALEKAAWLTRTWGDCYGYYLVATGRAAVMVDPLLTLWDAAALQPILIESGGRFTDWRGHDSVESGEGIGAAPQVLDEVLAITRQYC
jgi:histidinol phosphatase-like enzyme (inositol monophosphatase family)